MFQQTWLQSLWLATLFAFSGSALSGFGFDGDPPAKKKPTPAVIQGWVTNLGSVDFQAREEALASLIDAGKPAIAPLAGAVMSGDPEVAWRAATALEAIGLTGDESTLAEIKTRMEKTKGTPHRDLAAVLATLSQRWGEMQRVKAQTALVKLGATFPNQSAGMPMPSMMPVSGSFGAYSAMPVFSSPGTVVLESFSFAAPALPLAPARVVEFDPLTLPSSIKRLTDIVEDAKSVEEKKPDEGTTKEEPKAPEKDDEKKSEKTKPVEEKKVESTARSESKAETKETPEEKKEPTSDVAKLDEPADAPAAPVASDIVILSDSDAIDIAMAKPEVSFSYGEMSGVPTAAMYPGNVRLDKEWRGGDEGLVHLIALGNIVSIDIQDAPITDKAIETFKKIPALSSIMIRGTKMSPAALIKLAKEKSGLTIRGQSRGILGINAGDPGAECIVTMVTPDFPSAAAGVQVGDIIIKMDGKPVETFGQLTIWMMKKEPGDEVKITLRRGDETLEKKIKLGSREAITR